VEWEQQREQVIYKKKMYRLSKRRVLFLMLFLLYTAFVVCFALLFLGLHTHIHPHTPRHTQEFYPAPQTMPIAQP